jgi:hypothetical protein
MYKSEDRATRCNTQPSLHSPALQAAQPVFYEPCPPEEDESSHITKPQQHDYFEFKQRAKGK